MRLRIHRSAYLRIRPNHTQTTHHKQEEKVLHFWSPVPEHLPDQCRPVAGRVWPVLTESKLNTKPACRNLSLTARGNLVTAQLFAGLWRFHHKWGAPCLADFAR